MLPWNFVTLKIQTSDDTYGLGAAGELYIYTKSDGMIRVITGAAEN